MIRYLGLDYGRRRIGVAFAERGGWGGRPITTILRSRRLGHDLETIVRVAQRENAEAVVVGLPLNADSTEGPMALEVRQFGRALEKVSPVPVLYHNEFGTSEEAEADLILAGVRPHRRKQQIDPVAAVHLLERFLALREHSGAEELPR